MKLTSFSGFFALLVESSCFRQRRWIVFQDRSKLWSFEIDFVDACKVGLNLN